MPPQSFVARNRRRLLWGLAALALVGMGSLAFLNATSPTYACATEWQPAATAAPAPGTTQRLGYVQADLGRDHAALGAFIKYALCPPASGNHYNNPPADGPIRPGLYGPQDQAIPQGWIHNLEHGGFVLLYRCASGDTACSDSGQAALSQFNTSFPNSPLCNIPRGQTSPVVARFDQMKWPYAAIVWGVVLPLDSLDTTKILEFYAQSGERTNPESLCARPTTTPSATGTPGPSSSSSTSAPSTSAPTGSAAPSAGASPSPSAGAS